MKYILTQVISPWATAFPLQVSKYTLHVGNETAGITFSPRVQLLIPWCIYSPKRMAGFDESMCSSSKKIRVAHANSFKTTEMRVDGSITTIPGRYAKLLRTLRSLNNQDYPLDVIYLGISRESRRLKRPYPEIPDEIKQLCTIVMCDVDYGPCTKILGGLMSEDDPDTIIFTFDDDVVYSRNLVSSMISYHHKHPNSAIGSSGALIKLGFPFYSTTANAPGTYNRLVAPKITEEGRSVDILYGFSSVLYLRKFFPPLSELYDKFLKYPLMDEDVYINDDVMISALLSREKIDRRIFLGIPSVNEGKIHDPNIDTVDGNEISYDKIVFIQRLRRSINKVKEWGFFEEVQPVAVDETVVGNIGAVVIIVILLLILAFFFYLFLK